MLASSSNWLGIVDVVVGFVLTAMMALVGVIFAQVRNSLQANSDELKENSRHLQGLMFSVWRLLWRVDSVEDFLKKELQYDPPRSIPEWPFHTDDP